MHEISIRWLRPKMPLVGAGRWTAPLDWAARQGGRSPSRWCSKGTSAVALLLGLGPGGGAAAAFPCTGRVLVAAGTVGRCWVRPCSAVQHSYGLHLIKSFGVFFTFSLVYISGRLSELDMFSNIFNHYRLFIPYTIWKHSFCLMQRSMSTSIKIWPKL